MSTDPVIACTLSTEAEMAARVQDWQQVASRAMGREAVVGGLRLAFAPGPEIAGELARLAALEVGCCQWLTFSVDVSAEATALVVRAPDEGMDVVTSLFGTPS